MSTGTKHPDDEAMIESRTDVKDCGESVGISHDMTSTIIALTWSGTGSTIAE